MHSLSAAPADTSAWSFGGSILTFAFPMILFIVVACALYVVYTKPELVPGHRTPASERPVSYTAVPGKSGADDPVPGKSGTDDGEKADPEGGE